MEKINWTELHRLNRLWRQWMDAKSNFITPRTIILLRCARVECNEAADLEIRAAVPEMARNNERNHTIPGELAQVVMLALTALPDASYIYDKAFDACEPDMDVICDLASWAVIWAKDSTEGWRLPVADMLRMIAAYPGVNVETDLRKCWLALAWKHASYHMAQYPEELKP